ncbi:MAG: DUF378 domain-containing protein [Nanoarchaeota archaeon]
MAQNGLDIVTTIFLIIGGLNWGLLIFNFNLIQFLFKINWLVNFIYAVVAISAIYKIFTLPV